MAFTDEQYGAALARVLNCLQAVRNDEIAQLRARLTTSGHPDANFCNAFVTPTEGTLAEADHLTLHYYQYSFALSGALQINAHGLSDAMQALASDADIRTVRRQLYELYQPQP